MKKMNWVEPKITNLSVDKTEFGGKPTDHIDSHIKVGTKQNDYYSYS